MTGVYVLLGVPLEPAVLASILFRLVYYALPFAASLALYRHLYASGPGCSSSGGERPPQ